MIAVMASLRIVRCEAATGEYRKSPSPEESIDDYAETARATLRGTSESRWLTLLR